MARRLGLVLICAGALAGSALAAADRDPRDPQKQHNAADQRWAERIRVQRSDLGAGDWRVESLGNDDRNAPRQCKDPDLSDLVETGSAEKPDFSRNGSLVGSGAIVFKTEQQMATAWRRLARVPLAQCFVLAMKQGAAGSGVRIKITSNGAVRIPKLAPRFASGRVTVVLSGPSASIKGRLTYYLASRGRASVVLIVASFGRPATPISEALERRLATVVTQRLHG